MQTVAMVQLTAVFSRYAIRTVLLIPFSRCHSVGRTAWTFSMAAAFSQHATAARNAWHRRLLPILTRQWATLRARHTVNAPDATFPQIRAYTTFHRLAIVHAVPTRGAPTPYRYRRQMCGVAKRIHAPLHTPLRATTRDIKNRACIKR